MNELRKIQCKNDKLEISCVSNVATTVIIRMSAWGAHLNIDLTEGGEVLI